jgi:small-conductance mechanosensitive channel
MYVLGLFGINLGAIWGAMGIAGVAIGFAAQTTVSNLISGIFIVTEKTMKIGDFIEVDGVAGTVDRVGLLSIKIHTPNNQLIRIPSSSVINAKLKNFSSYEYRRYVFEVSVDYSTDLDKALEVLQSVPAPPVPRHVRLREHGRHRDCGDNHQFLH